MITAWVFFLDTTGKSLEERYKFEERNGSAGYDSIKPEDWGLVSGKHLVLGVFQKASFIQMWLRGHPLKDH